jgi:hypothetical protein
MRPSQRALITRVQQLEKDNTKLQKDNQRLKDAVNRLCAMYVQPNARKRVLGAMGFYDEEEDENDVVLVEPTFSSSSKKRKQEPEVIEIVDAPTYEDYDEATDSEDEKPPRAKKQKQMRGKK